MHYDIPPAGAPYDPAWWLPLEHWIDRVAPHPLARFLDIGDFMHMGKIVRRGADRRDLYVYKHHFTRRHVHLDEQCTTYRFIASKAPHARQLGQHRPWPAEAALHHLDLHHLPWMKPGLEGEQRGLPYEDAWMLLPAEDIDLEPPTPPARLRHLRAV